MPLRCGWLTSLLSHLPGSVIPKPQNAPTTAGSRKSLNGDELPSDTDDEVGEANAPDDGLKQIEDRP